MPPQVAMGRHIVHRASFVGDFLNALFLRDPYLEPVSGEGTADRALTVEQLAEETQQAPGKNYSSAAKPGNSTPVVGPETAKAAAVEAEGEPVFRSRQEEENVGEPLTEGQLRLARKLLSRHAGQLRLGLKNDLSKHRYTALDAVAMRAAAHERATRAAESLEGMAGIFERSNAEQGFLLQVVAEAIRRLFESNLEALSAEAQFEARVQASDIDQKPDSRRELVGALVHISDLTPSRIASFGFEPMESLIIQAAIEGKTYESIATQLNTDIVAVKKTIENAYSQLGVNSIKGLESALRLLCVREAEETFYTVRGILEREVAASHEHDGMAGAMEAAFSSGLVVADQHNQANVPHRI